MATEDKVSVIDEMQKIDALSEVRQEGSPAAGADDIALTHVCEERFKCFSVGEQCLDRAECLHTSYLAAVAADAVITHVDVLDRATVPVLAAQDRPFCDHGATKMTAEREIKGIREIRRGPKLRDGCAFRIVNKGAWPRKMIGKNRQLQPCTGEDLSVENAFFISRDQRLHGKTDAENL